MSLKRKNSAYLFDTIGTLDDALIDSARSPVAARKAIKTQKRLRTLAVAAVLALVITGGAIDQLRFPSPDKATPVTEVPSLSEVLMQTNEPIQVEQDTLNFFDGQTKLVWRTNEANYHCLIIEKTDKEELYNSLAHSGKPLSPHQSKEIPLSVWICNGDGTVYSPYLKQTDGNTGYGALFSYCPEQEPSRSFTKLIQTLLSQI